MERKTASITIATDFGAAQAEVNVDTFTEIHVYNPPNGGASFSVMCENHVYEDCLKSVSALLNGQPVGQPMGPDMNITHMIPGAMAARTISTATKLIDVSSGAALSKPPTQIAWVQGIDATRFPADNPPPVNRHRLAELPPFQMFAAEKRQLPAALVLQDEAVNEYIQWHQSKGYWPNETPFGELA